MDQPANNSPQLASRLIDRPSPRRILISRLSAHGDVLQTLPLLGVLKAANPTLFVGWAVEASAAPLLQDHPLIDRLHVSQRKDWLSTLKQRPWQAGRIWAEWQRFIGTIKAERYDTALDVQGLLKSAIIPFAAGVPTRLGYARTRENASLLYTHTLPPHQMTNPSLPTVVKFSEFSQYLGLIAPCTPEIFIEKHLQFPLAPNSVQTVQRVTALLQTLTPHRPRVGLALGTMWQSKAWPAIHWHSLIETLLNNQPAPMEILLLGGPSEAQLAEELMAAFEHPAPLHNCVGQTQLEDLLALMPHLAVLVGLDSAPLHAANAVAYNKGKPYIVGLFGPTAPGRTGPINPPNKALHQTLTTQLECQPCFKRTCPLGTTECMAKLQPGEVAQAVWQALQREAAMPQQPSPQEVRP